MMAPAPKPAMTPYHQEEKASVSTSLIMGHIPLLISYPKHTGYPLSLENIQKDNVYLIRFYCYYMQGMT